VKLDRKIVALLKHLGAGAPDVLLTGRNLGQLVPSPVSTPNVPYGQWD
jgi:hypothetical protein